MSTVDTRTRGEYYRPMNDYFDDLNPAFRDEEAFIDLDFFAEEDEEFEDEELELFDGDDDFDEMLEYDDWQDFTHPEF
jgi:hypothetical protein